MGTVPPWVLLGVGVVLVFIWWIGTYATPRDPKSGGRGPMDPE
jgi:hypothetical protein